MFSDISRLCDVSWLNKPNKKVSILKKSNSRYLSLIQSRLNRGNHEDSVMNHRYGFTREVQLKYRNNSEKLLKLIDQVFRHLPLGTLINNKIFVVHGGISETTDLNLIASVRRSKVKGEKDSIYVIKYSPMWEFNLQFPTLSLHSMYQYCVRQRSPTTIPTSRPSGSK